MVWATLQIWIPLSSLFNRFKTAEDIYYSNEQDRPGTLGNFLLLNKVLASKWFAGNGFKGGRILSCWVHSTHPIRATHWHGKDFSFFRVFYLIFTFNLDKAMWRWYAWVSGSGSGLCVTKNLWRGLLEIQSLPFEQVNSYSTYLLCHSVDVDFSLLQACTEEHWRSHQKIVSYTVSINIQRCNLTTVIGANL